MDRDSFITYKTWVEGIEEMPEELQAKAYRLIAHYALYGETPDKNTPWELRSFFYGNVKKFIDDNIQKYEELTERRREAGRKGMAKRWSKNDTQSIDNKKVNNKNNNVISVINKNNKNNNVISVNNKNNLYDDDDVYVDDNDNKKKIDNKLSIKEKTTTKKVFTPPTIDEVQQYISEKNYQVDAEAFVAYYDSNGWMVGRNKMKNWKAAIVTWQKKEKQYQNQNQNTNLIISNNGTRQGTSKNGADKHDTIARQNDIFDEYIRKADEEWHEQQRLGNGGRVTTIIPEQID